MFQRLFGRRRSANRAVTDALYERIVAAARQPAFYSEWQVPDTPLGRFEMLSLHMLLFLRRMRGMSGPPAELAQEITDEFFRDVEHSLRELGIGDLGIPKRMKKLARMFYGRTKAYDEALDAGDGPALAAALTRNIRPDAGDWPQASALAAYATAADAALKAEDGQAILRGELSFPEPDIT